jgi:hypothetical protein
MTGAIIRPVSKNSHCTSGSVRGWRIRSRSGMYALPDGGKITLWPPPEQSPAGILAPGSHMVHNATYLSALRGCATRLLDTQYSQKNLDQLLFPELP